MWPVRQLIIKAFLVSFRRDDFTLAAWSARRTSIWRSGSDPTTGLGHHVGHGGVRVVTGVGPAALFARDLYHRASRGDRAKRERGGGRTVRAALGEDIIG